MVCDNKELEKMFIDKPGVYFLDMEDKLNKTKQTTRKIGQRKTGADKYFRKPLQNEKHQEVLMILCLSLFILLQ
jgi:hypothetical protein